jgi:hypothetical protein
VLTEGNEQATKGVGALDAGAHQRNTLVIAQRNDTAWAFLKHLQAARAPVEPFPVTCHRKQVGERRHLTIDGAVRCPGVDTLLLISIHSEASDRVEPHVTEERLQVHAQLPALDRDVLAGAFLQPFDVVVRRCTKSQSQFPARWQRQSANAGFGPDLLDEIFALRPGNTITRSSNNPVNARFPSTMTATE